LEKIESTGMLSMLRVKRGQRKSAALHTGTEPRGGWAEKGGSQDGKKLFDCLRREAGAREKRMKSRISV
jgi:hypothetical protein